MKSSKKLENYYTALGQIDFAKKYKCLSERYNKFENRLTKMDKPTILKVFNSLGYAARLSSPGQYYLIEEKIEDYTFKIMFQISGVY
jgi:hypothetical protein